MRAPGRYYQTASWPTAGLKDMKTQDLRDIQDWRQDWRTFEPKPSLSHAAWWPQGGRRIFVYLCVSIVVGH